jgi:hypothetical protein
VRTSANLPEGKLWMSLDRRPVNETLATLEIRTIVPGIYLASNSPMAYVTL